MHFTKKQFENYKNVCHKLRIPRDLIHIHKRKFLKLLKAKQNLRYVIIPKIKVCRKRIFITRIVKQIGIIHKGKIRRVSKTTNANKKVCRDIWLFLYKVLLNKNNLSEKKQKRKWLSMQKLIRSRTAQKKRSKLSDPANESNSTKLATQSPANCKSSPANNTSNDIIYDLTEIEDPLISNMSAVHGSTERLAKGEENSEKMEKSGAGDLLREEIQSQLNILRQQKYNESSLFNKSKEKLPREPEVRSTIEIVDLDEILKDSQDSYHISRYNAVAAKPHEDDDDDVAIVSIVNRDKPSTNKIVDFLYDKYKLDTKDCFPMSTETENASNGNAGDSNVKGTPKKELEALDDSLSSYSDFFGFDNDNDEVIKNLKNNPDLLPTPYVSKVRSHAAFLPHDVSINEINIHDNSANDESLTTPETDTVGLANKFSTPPKLKLPARPTNMEKPRTVAQKRILLEGSEDIRYHMLENESKIYCHLNKRQKSADQGEPTPLLEIELMTTMQRQNIPFTRDAWKALAWLRTESSKYFFHTVIGNGVNCKIVGSRGNHEIRAIDCTNDTHKKSNENACTENCNCPEFPDNINLILPETNNTPSDAPAESRELALVKPKEKLRLHKTIHDSLPNLKPGPLSFKLKQCNKTTKDYDDCFLSTVHAYNLPQIKVKVCPQLNRPLNEGVRPFLKMILPHDNITEEWAKFTASAVISNTETAQPENKSDEFSFLIPYRNNQEKMLVRERTSSETNINNDDPTKMFRNKLRFGRNIRKKDKLGREIAKMLTDMTNSVALSVAENNFIRDDPDISYDETNSNNDLLSNEIPKPCDDNDARINSKVLKELKKLNAKIITATDSTMKRFPAKCNQKHCEMGCVCESLNQEVQRLHCGDPKCFFGCQCIKKADYINDISTDCDKTSLSNDDLNFLCAKATANLAREERNFAPTIILTNNTMLIHNRNCSQRRITKVPKKFSDYESEDMIQSSQGSSTSTIVEVPNLPEQPPEVAPVKEVPLKRNKGLDHMRHVKVCLKQLPDVHDVEPFCMVHNLYKCYCKYLSVEGKIFKFDEENDFNKVVHEDLPKTNDLLIQKSDALTNAIYRKRRYSFDKPNSIDDSRLKKVNKIIDQKIKSAGSQNLTISHLFDGVDCFNVDDENNIPNYAATDCVARRVCPLNRNFYRARNLHKRDIYITRSKELIGDKELQIQTLLETRIKQCVNFYRQQAQNKKSEPAKPVVVDASNVNNYINLCDTDENIVAYYCFRLLVEYNNVLLCINRKLYIIKVDKHFDDFVNQLFSVTDKNKFQVFIIQRININSDKNTVQSDPKNNIPVFNIQQIIYFLQNFHDRLNTETVHTITQSIKTLITSIQTTPIQDLICYSTQVNNNVIIPNINSINNICSSSSSRNSSFINNTDSITNDNSKVNHIHIMNSRISITMQSIYTMILKNANRIHHPSRGILYLLNWSYLIKAFSEKEVNIYELENSSSKKIIITSFGHKIESAELFLQYSRVVNLRDKNCDKFAKDSSLLFKMLLYSIEKITTSNLVLLLQGCNNYWVVDGFLNTTFNFLTGVTIPRPTPETHPRIKNKIALYYDLLVQKNNLNGNNENLIGDMASSNEKTPVKKDLPLTESFSMSSKNPLKVFLEDNELLLPSIPNQNSKSNIEIMPSNLKQDMRSKPNERYFALTFVNDFSDLYIPSWDTYISYDKIMYAIQIAQSKGGIIEVTSSHTLEFNEVREDMKLYAIPERSNRIFIGPFTDKSDTGLMLYQNIDGKMFLREEYLNKNNVLRMDKTTASWICVPTGALKAKYSIDLANICILTNSECIILDSDDDCDDHLINNNSNNKTNVNPNVECLINDIDYKLFVEEASTSLEQQAKPTEQRLTIKTPDAVNAKSLAEVNKVASTDNNSITSDVMKLNKSVNEESSFMTFSNIVPQKISTQIDNLCDIENIINSPRSSSTDENQSTSLHVNENCNEDSVKQNINEVKVQNIDLKRITLQETYFNMNDKQLFDEQILVTDDHGKILNISNNFQAPRVQGVKRKSDSSHELNLNPEPSISYHEDFSENNQHKMPKLTFTRKRPVTSTVTSKNSNDAPELNTSQTQNVQQSLLPMRTASSANEKQPLAQPTPIFIITDKNSANYQFIASKSAQAGGSSQNVSMSTVLDNSLLSGGALSQTNSKLQNSASSSDKIYSLSQPTPPTNAANTSSLLKSRLMKTQQETEKSAPINKYQQLSVTSYKNTVNTSPNLDTAISSYIIKKPPSFMQLPKSSECSITSTTIPIRQLVEPIKINIRKNTVSTVTTTAPKCSLSQPSTSNSYMNDQVANTLSNNITNSANKFAIPAPSFPDSLSVNRISSSHQNITLRRASTENSQKSQGLLSFLNKTTMKKKLTVVKKSQHQARGALPDNLKSLSVARKSVSGSVLKKLLQKNLQLNEPTPAVPCAVISTPEAPSSNEPNLAGNVPVSMAHLLTKLSPNILVTQVAKTTDDIQMTSVASQKLCKPQYSLSQPAVQVAKTTDNIQTANVTLKSFSTPHYSLSQPVPKKSNVHTINKVITKKQSPQSLDTKKKVYQSFIPITPDTKELPYPYSNHLVLSQTVKKGNASTSNYKTISSSFKSTPVADQKNNHIGQVQKVERSANNSASLLKQSLSVNRSELTPLRNYSKMHEANSKAGVSQIGMNRQLAIQSMNEQLKAMNRAVLQSNVNHDVIVIDDDNETAVAIPKTDTVVAPINKPPLVKGFIISDVEQLGRIRAAQDVHGKIHVKSTVPLVLDKSDLNSTFGDYIRNKIMGTIPTSFNFNWRFVTDPGIYSAYHLHNGGECDKNYVIGYKLFCDISNESSIKKYKQYNEELLAYRLLSMVAPNYQIQSCMFKEINDLAVKCIQILEIQGKAMQNIVQTLGQNNKKFTKKVKSLRGNSTVIILDNDDD